MKRAVALGLVAALVVGVLLARRARAPRQPHVVVYLIDTLRADRLGVYGYRRGTTPVIDALARESRVFERAYASTSWTKPSVGSLFTGLLPSEHGAVGREDVLRPDVPTMAEVFRDGGYTTAAFVSNPNVLPIFAFDRGFQSFHDVEAIPRSATAQDVHQAVYDYLDGKPQGPLFLYVHTRDPHSPYLAPEAFRDMYVPPGKVVTDPLDPDRYDGEVRYADDRLGDFLAQLRSRGLLEDTIFVLLSDHGEEFGEHGGTEHGRTLYEEQLHVPLLVRLPGGTLTGREAKPVRTTDLLATLADMTGLAAPNPDRSFARLLDPHAPARTYAPLFFAELDVDRNTAVSLMEGRHKLIRTRRPEDRAGDELFDLAKDVRETKNVAPEAPELARHMGTKAEEVVAGLTGGLYVEVANSRGAEARSRLEATLEVTHGELLDVRVPSATAAGPTTSTREGSRVRLAFELANRANPIGQGPPVLADALRLQLRTSPGARLRLDVRVEGRPPGEPAYVLGRATRVPGSPLDVDLADARLEVGSGRAPSGRAGIDGVYARVYRLPEAKRERVVIDPDTAERLRALGYVTDTPAN